MLLNSKRPFHAHGGGEFEQDIKNDPNSIVSKVLAAYNSGGSQTGAQIDAWLSAIGLPSRKYKHRDKQKQKERYNGNYAKRNAGIHERTG